MNADSNARPTAQEGSWFSSGNAALLLLGAVIFAVACTQQAQQDVFVDEPTSVPSRSLPNGSQIAPPVGLQGLGELRVSNGTSLDAVVKLVEQAGEGKAIRSSYVRANSSVRFNNIEECTCRLLFSLGRDWDAASGTFTQDVSFSEFEDLLVFKETNTGSGTQFSTFEATLNAVAGGNAETASIDAERFRQK